MSKPNKLEFNLPPDQHTLRYIYERGILPTVKNFLTMNYFGEITSLDQVGEEDVAEILSLIEDGLLVDTESEHAN